MTNSSSRSPIIVIGMHRSGTSLVCRLMEQMGVFMGQKKDANNEALFFAALNNWMLKQCGGAWDNPDSFRYLLQHPDLVSSVQDYLRFSMASPRAASYLGWKRYRKAGSAENLTELWGWKDPRNTFTLPVWLGIFPHAKIVNVTRHGVDVSSSLYQRNQKSLAVFRKRYEKLKWLYAVQEKRLGFAQSPRCCSLEGGFALWLEYMDMAHEQSTINEGRTLNIQYETLLEEPTPALRALSEFCGIPLSEHEQQQLAKGITKGRAFAYKDDAGLLAFAKEHEAVLHQHGYTAD